MSVQISVPTALRPVMGGQKMVEVDPGQADALLKALGQTHPGFTEAVLTAEGNVHGHMSVFVGEERLSTAQDLTREVPDGARMTILTAVAGGSG